MKVFLICKTPRRGLCGFVVAAKLFLLESGGNTNWTWRPMHTLSGSQPGSSSRGSLLSTAVDVCTVSLHVLAYTFGRFYFWCGAATLLLRFVFQTVLHHRETSKIQKEDAVIISLLSLREQYPHAANVPEKLFKNGTQAHALSSTRSSC